MKMQGAEWAGRSMEETEGVVQGEGQAQQEGT